MIGIGIVLAGLAVYIFFETKDSPERLKPLIGIGSLLSIGFIFSKHPTKVSPNEFLLRKERHYICMIKIHFQINWRPVILGLAMQFLLGIFCIRWEVGRDIFS